MHARETMERDARGAIDDRTPPLATGRLDAPRSYRMYGVPVVSEIALPLSPCPSAASSSSAWTFRVGDPNRRPVTPEGPEIVRWWCARGDHPIAIRYRGTRGYWVWNPQIATFHVVPETRSVEVYPELWPDDPIIGLTLTGEIAILILQALGCPSLHASAVTAPRGAAVFVGPSGHGKSTMGLAFLERGAKLLTDDSLPLRVRDGEVVGGPGLPMMKVWPETIERAATISHDLPDLLPNYDKKLLVLDGAYGFVDSPTRLAAVYALNRYDPRAADRDDVVIRTLSGREGLTILLAHTSYQQLMTPAEIARFLPLYSRLLARTPVRLLSYPNGFAYQDKVWARIVEDVGNG